MKKPIHTHLIKQKDWCKISLFSVFTQWLRKRLKASSCKGRRAYKKIVFSWETSNGKRKVERFFQRTTKERAVLFRRLFFFSRTHCAIAAKQVIAMEDMLTKMFKNVSGKHSLEREKNNFFRGFFEKIIPRFLSFLI